MVKLKDIEAVWKNFLKRKDTDENLSKLHHVLFKHPHKKKYCKRSIGNYSGPISHKEKMSLKAQFQKLTVEVLRDCCDLFNLRYTTHLTKEGLVNKLLDFMETLVDKEENQESTSEQHAAAVTNFNVEDSLVEEFVNMKLRVAAFEETCKLQEEEISLLKKKLSRAEAELHKSEALRKKLHNTILVEAGILSKARTPTINFVLGGLGVGKVTQCARIADTYGFTHLSVGDLLRKEISSNSEYGAMILDTITKGKIVSSEVTVKLLKSTIESSKTDRFLIDGFPRSEENRVAYERIIGIEPEVVLFFDCDEEEMLKRVLHRNQGRVDDNVDTTMERLKVFEAYTLPVIRYYSEKGKLYKINALGTEDEIFERVKPIFAT